MIQSMGKRYEATSQILLSTTGSLYYGKDLSLQREVIIYTTENMESASFDEYIRKLRKASSLTHEGFQHILDTSFEERSLLVVLKHRSGKPLIQELNQRIWTFPEILTLAAGLGVSMLDAMEHQITGFSVSSDNLWLSEDGRLSVINHWEHGEPQTSGAIGLCGLMIQLFSRSAEISDPSELLNTNHFRINLLQGTTVQKDAFIQLTERVYQGKAALYALVSGLRDLLQEKQPTAEEKPAAFPVPAVFPLPKLLNPQRTAEGVVTENIPIDPNPAFNEKENPFFYKKLVIAASCLIAAAMLIWIVYQAYKPERNPSVISSKPDQESTSQITVQPMQLPTEVPATSDNGESLGQDVSIPNLIGMTQADAEKQALSSGLHYNYVLEANSQAKGSVFKQDPQPGTKASKGDNVSFWVSKGSP